jgi:hypothetical protein
MKRKDGRFAEEKKLATPLSRRKTATQASQSRRFPENARGKYRHCSASALAGLASFADRSTPLHLSAPVNAGAASTYAERFTAFQRPQTAETGLRSGAPQVRPAKTSSLCSSRGSNRRDAPGSR